MNWEFAMEQHSSVFISILVVVGIVAVIALAKELLREFEHAGKLRDGADGSGDGEDQ